MRVVSSPVRQGLVARGCGKLTGEWSSWLAMAMMRGVFERMLTMMMRSGWILLPRRERRACEATTKKAVVRSAARAGPARPGGRKVDEWMYVR